MSTAWFIADKDGNVAIFEFDENGPVPCDIPETSIDGILEDDFIWPDELGVCNFNFDDDQADLILKNLVDVQDFDGYNHYIIQIDVSQTNAFILLAQKWDCLKACYSKSKGLYLIDPYDVKEKVNNMIKEGVIQKAKELHFEYSEAYDLFPFYRYLQPYWTVELMERTFVPRNKFKIHQFASKDQERILHLPINFDDYPKLQIAEFLPSGCTGSEYASIQCRNFALLPLSNGEDKYVSIDFPPVPGWSKCYTKTPTILFIGKNRERDMFYGPDAALRLYMKSCSVFPYETTSWMDKEEPIKKMTGKIDEQFVAKIKKFRDDWEKYFSKYDDYWDIVFDVVNPHVVIIEDEFFEKVAKDLNIESGKISILGMEYPYYLISEVDEREVEIKSLAEQPYRGKKFLLTIDKEDMEKWLKENERDPLD